MSYASGVLSIAICDRCRIQRRYTDLKPDGNSPGLFVCTYECWDPLDPYRLPARRTEDIALHHPRPDAPLSNPDYGLSPDGEMFLNEIYIMTEDGYILQP